MKLEPRPAIDMEKLHLTAVSWVDGASGECQGRANRIRQADGVSAKVPACWFCDSVGGGFRKGTRKRLSVPQLSP